MGDLYTIYIQPLISKIIVEVAVSIFTFLASLYIENKFGVVKRLIRLYHYVKNSGVHVIINVVYDSSLPFADLKEYVKDSFRERYDKLKLYKDSPQNLDFMVDDSFHIYAFESPNNEVSIRTSKINFRMQGIKRGVSKILDTLNKAKEKDGETKGPVINLKEKEFSLYLYLPYEEPFTKIHVPKNIKIKDYEIKLSDEDHGSMIKLRADFVNINTKHRYDLEGVIKHFI